MDATNNTPSKPAIDPLSFPVSASFNIPAEEYHKYALMRKVFGLSDSEMAEQAVRFAVFCYGIGLVKNKQDMTESLVHQLCSFKVLKGRMIQQHNELKQLESLLTASVTQAMHAIAAHTPDVQHQEGEAV